MKYKVITSKRRILFFLLLFSMLCCVSITAEETTDSKTGEEPVKTNELVESGAPKMPEKPSATGIPARIVSLSFYGNDLREITRVIDIEGAKGIDLVCLPEAWTGPDTLENLEGKTIREMSRLAKKHFCYIVCPIYRLEEDRLYNSVVLIDREGKIVCIYDKVYPYWSEFDMTPPVVPGQKDVEVYETDFGKIGFAVCYDAKFPEIWQRLRDKGAELVIWPSAYSGGTELQAFALLHHYYIVTSTYTRDCLVYDITGKCLLDEKRISGINVSRFTLDMDRRIFHYNFNEENRDRLLQERGNDIMLEIDMPREEWFVLKAKRPGVSVRRIAQQYGLEELRDYKDRSRWQINRIRGFDFTEKFGAYPVKAE